MSRMTTLDDVMFRVNVVPAAAVVETAAGTRLIRAKTVRAVVDAEDDRVLGVVGDGYRLVTNEQALDWARRCGQAVFPRTSPSDWSVFSVDGPSSGSFCRIDVAHRQTVLNFAGQTPGVPRDAFGPFIRVTNSYNGQRALRFDIGLLRWICTNGMLIADQVVTFRFTHSKVALPQAPEFRVNQPKLSAWLDGFEANIAMLQGRMLTHAVILDLVLGVLRLRPPSAPDASAYLVSEWEAIQSHLQLLISRYTKEVGENAYAAFNVMTDFATRPKGRGSYAREPHTLQRRVGVWMPDFCKRCRQPDFRMPDYLIELHRATGAPAYGPATRISGRA